MSTPLLLPGVDLAAFAVALVARVRAAGVAVAASGPAGFVAALRHLRPRSRTELYWAARLTLVNRVEDLAAFDAAFDALFGDTGVGLEPPARSSRSIGAGSGAALTGAAGACVCPLVTAAAVGTSSAAGSAAPANFASRDSTNWPSSFSDTC